MRSSLSRPSAMIVVGLLVLACGSATSPAPSSVTATATPVDNAPQLWTATGNMVTVRTYPTATLLPDGTVLVVGGVRTDATFGPEPVATAEMYDPASGSWTTTGSMSEARFGHTATLLPDGIVLVAGGSNSVIDSPASATAELYDPETGSWTATERMIEARFFHTATLLRDGRVLVAGGCCGGLIASAELYDPDSGSWTATGEMSEARNEGTATRLPDGTVLVVGGSSVELYDPRAGSWTATGNMKQARSNHTATLLPDGKVLVAGGRAFGSDLVLASAELYDLGTGIWTATGSLAAARIYHTATLLADGTVLLAGGYRDGSGALALAELYDPGSGSWATAGTTITARYNHVATRLLDGTVLVAGGSESGAPASAELYDPGGGS